MSVMKIATKVVALLLMMWCGLAQAEWVRFASTADGKVYTYDPARIASLPDGKIKVWYRIAQSAQSKIADIEAEAVDAEKTLSKEVASLFREKIPRFRNYSHTLHRTIFDCRQQKYFDEESIDYSDDGAVLDRLDWNALVAQLGVFGGNRFSEVFPGSYIEMLMTKVCK